MKLGTSEARISDQDNCVTAGEGAGKAMSECRMKTVILTVLDPTEDPAPGLRHGAHALRQHRILRLTEEAREQGGLLSQEDLTLLLACDVRTIRRDIRFQRETCGILVATRGQRDDIGPGVTHKAVAIGHWPEGAEPLSVANRIHHSLSAVERYIPTFCRCVFLHRRGFHPLQITLTVGISTAGVRTYLDIYELQKGHKAFANRFEEIDLIGKTHFEAEDQKKGARLRPPVVLQRKGRQP